MLRCNRFSCAAFLPPLLACSVGVGGGALDLVGNSSAAADPQDDDPQATSSESESGAGDDAPIVPSTEGDASSSGTTGPLGCGADLDLDASNCGACGHDCQGGACSAGSCQTFVVTTGVELPTHMHVHGETLYIGSDSGLLAAPKSGGAFTTLTGGHARAIVVDDDRIHWIDELEASLSAVPTGGGAREILVQGIDEPYALAGDDEHLFWIDGDVGVMRIAKAGGPVEIAIAADGTGFVPWQIEVADGHVYWRSEDGELRAAGTDGSDDVVLAIGDEMRAVAVNSTDVFAMRREGDNTINTLLRVPRSGGAILELIGGQPDVFPIAVDDAHVAWATQSGNPTRVLAMPIAGGPTRIVDEFVGEGAAVLLHEGALYWSDELAGTISKLVL